MREGERQVAPTIDGIRRDHVARYEFAVKVLNGCAVVIDYACGVGYGSKMLADVGHSVDAYDIDHEALKYASQHYKGPYYCQVKSDKPDVLRPADAAVCFETIEHLEDPRPLLKALHKAAPRLIASVPNEEVMPYEYEPGKGYAFHFRHYTKAQFADLLRECGWQPVYWYGQEGPESEVEPDVNGRTLIVTAKRLEGKPKRKIAIVGGHPKSMDKAPFDDPEWEIWVHGNQMDKHESRRVTRIFEIHDDLSEHGDPIKYAEWLVAKQIPMSVGAGFPVQADHVEPFPFDDANRFMGEHLTSTPAYMMAYALLQGADEIAIYGVDMAVDDHEYFYQRPAMYAWIGYALGRGVKVSIPKASSLFKDTYVEGRKSGGKPKLGQKPFTEGEFRALLDRHEQKKQNLRAQMERLQAEYNTHDGCTQAYEKMAITARAIESGQVIESLTQTTVVI